MLVLGVLLRENDFLFGFEEGKGSGFLYFIVGVVVKRSEYSCGLMFPGCLCDDLLLVVLVGGHHGCYFSVLIYLCEFSPLVEHQLPLHPPLALRLTLVPVYYLNTVVNPILLYALLSPLLLLLLLHLITQHVVIIILPLLSLSLLLVLLLLLLLGVVYDTF